MFLSRIIIIFLFLCVSVLNAAEPFVTFISADAKLPLVTPQNRSFSIWCDDAEHRGVLLAVRNLQTDFEKVNVEALFSARLKIKESAGIYVKKEEEIFDIYTVKGKVNSNAKIRKRQK